MILIGITHFWGGHIDTPEGAQIEANAPLYPGTDRVNDVTEWPDTNLLRNEQDLESYEGTYSKINKLH